MYYPKVGLRILDDGNKATHISMKLKRVTTRYPILARDNVLRDYLVK